MRDAAPARQGDGPAEAARGPVHAGLFNGCPLRPDRAMVGPRIAAPGAPQPASARDGDARRNPDRPAQEGVGRVRTFAWAAVAVVLACAAAAEAAAHDENGAQLFHEYCSVCHSTEPGKNKMGPSLAGVVGRRAGSLANYSYSEAMKHSGLTWTATTLAHYLTAPQRFIPHVKMMFLGVKSARERQAIIAYLTTLKD